MSSQYEAFRQEVRAFVRTALPPEVREKVRLGIEPNRDELMAWQQKLAERGWLAPGWPPEWQGTGWSAEQRAIFQDELAIGHAPESGGASIGMIGPILIRYGTPEQKQYFLPRILNLEHWWCQGYSEPNSGSDLASLRTRAERKTRPDGQEVYLINGSKIWTSGAHHANWIFCLVRTDLDAKAQHGISFLLIDMTSPGVTVRPIQGIHGWSLFNQVFFDDVEVPVWNRVGEENQGWAIAKSLLEHERLNLSRVAENRRRLEKLREIAAEVQESGQPLCERPWFRQRFLELEVRLETLAATVLRFRKQAQAGVNLGPETGMLKLIGSQLIQDIENLVVDALGPDTVAFDADALVNLPASQDRYPFTPAASSRRFVTRGYTIAGGSSEIQHEMLAKQVLGL